MKYEEAIEYLEQLNKRGIHPGLKGINLLCDACNNPENSLKAVQVVGTNGKGSTSLFLANILQASGLKVGRYSSPAVFDDNEIISINGKNISKHDYARLVEYVAKREVFGVTRFEIETVMAFLYFVEKKCDVVVLEAGMGGALDATNFVPSNIMSVITPIGFDHMQYLGNTLREIADTKTGVIKPKSITVTTLQDSDVLGVTRSRAELLHNKFYVSDYTKASHVRYTLDGTSFSYMGIADLKINLCGTTQVENACLAITAAMALANNEVFDICEKHIRKGLERTTERGRFEIIGKRPYIVLDGAHNEPAAVKLKENIDTYFTKNNKIYIIGMLKDKDVEKFVSILVPGAMHVLTVTSPNKLRALPAVELGNIVKKYNTSVSAIDSIEEACEFARLMSDSSTAVFVCGSFTHLKKADIAMRNYQNRKDSHGVKARK